MLKMQLKDSEIRLLLSVECEKQGFSHGGAAREYLVYYMSYEQLCEYAFDVVTDDVIDTANAYMIPLPWHVLLTDGYRFRARCPWECPVQNLEDYRCLEQIFPQCRDSILLKPDDFMELYPSSMRELCRELMWISKEKYEMLMCRGYVYGMEYLVDWTKVNIHIEIEIVNRSDRSGELSKIINCKPYERIRPLRIRHPTLRIVPQKYRDRLFVNFYSPMKDGIEVGPVEFYKVLIRI